MPGLTARSTRLAISVILVLALAGSAYAYYNAGPTPAQQAVVITIDAARADTFWQLYEQHAGPLLRQETTRGVRADHIDTVDPSVTPVAHTSLFSGANPVAFAFALPETGVEVDTLFKVLQGSGRPTVFIDSKGGRLKGLEVGATVVYGDRDFRPEGLPAGQSMPTDLLLAELGSSPVLSFLLLPMSDDMGHKHGADSDEYRQAIVVALEQVERVLDKLQSQGALDRTIVVVTADHGMTGSDHDDASIPTNRQVPLIMSGPGLKAGCALTGGQIIDIAPTLASLLGIPVPADSEGSVWTQCLDEGSPVRTPWAAAAGLAVLLLLVVNLPLPRDARSNT